MRAPHAAAPIAALALAAAVVTAPPAQAAEPETHCWQDVETGAGACYGTYDEVLAAVSGAARSARQRDGLAPLAVMILGEVFEDLNYGGSSNTFTASSGCDTNADVDWQVSSMPSGWNDRVSSFKSYGQCATRVWSDTGYSGSSYGFVGNSTYVGAALNDQTSSIQWN